MKRGPIGGAARPVYEEEESLFVHDLSDQVLQDDVLARLLTFRIRWSRLTRDSSRGEALANIADTLGNVRAFERREALDKLNNACRLEAELR